MNDMADDTWDDKAPNRISAIRFLDDDDDEEEDDDQVRPARANLTLAEHQIGISRQC